jgi:NADH dehydrogenase FAD-containing subunit
VDTLIAAIGQEPEVPAALGVEADRRSRIKVDPRTLATGVPGLYAGGDAVTGPASVIEAIAAGRRAAVSIDLYLGGSGRIDETLAAPDPESWPAVVEAAGRWKRTPTRTRPARSRLKSFVQVEEGYSAARARREACRCLRCDLEK